MLQWGWAVGPMIHMYITLKKNYLVRSFHFIWKPEWFFFLINVEYNLLIFLPNEITIRLWSFRPTHINYSTTFQVLEFITKNI